MSDKVEIGRLALRREGNWWRAFWAKSQTSMDDVVQLGQIKMSLVEGRPEVKEAFMACMKLAFDGMVEEMTGQKPTWSDPRPGPESERGGHA
jgi:hypothetical protein